ncbi:uncharacterized protein AMSG_11767 [Thecamonas trahens ATCC 50062]|uniref:VPS9 domain-containing protein n=1 Tax=Thecamonas trahens ATCC 50062 TaxID=461836 RepID=A0A0L0D3T4_THETB|nr:hypothetical protein AMSG_11767 [Thecamonas trahens ATCC 50062]KNC47007.1 hypothetical protein AMSG_11767 [Thecamonas trahens ATCC 50062]|eukprot:XP_013760000.1 hypothetical protein AMSG_11767 [Thecamonas trahens ATCC 50062]
MLVVPEPVLGTGFAWKKNAKLSNNYFTTQSPSLAFGSRLLGFSRFRVVSSICSFMFASAESEEEIENDFYRLTRAYVKEFGEYHKNNLQPDWQNVIIFFTDLAERIAAADGRGEALADLPSESGPAAGPRHVLKAQAEAPAEHVVAPPSSPTLSSSNDPRSALERAADIRHRVEACEWADELDSAMWSRSYALPPMMASPAMAALVEADRAWLHRVVTHCFLVRNREEIMAGLDVTMNAVLARERSALSEIKTYLPVLLGRIRHPLGWLAASCKADFVELFVAPAEADAAAGRLDPTAVREALRDARAFVDKAAGTVADAFFATFAILTSSSDAFQDQVRASVRDALIELFYPALLDLYSVAHAEEHARFEANAAGMADMSPHDLGLSDKFVDGFLASTALTDALATMANHALPVRKLKALIHGIEKLTADVAEHIARTDAAAVLAPQVMVVLGAGGVGKTTLVRSVAGLPFDADYDPTPRPDLVTTRFRLESHDSELPLTLVDTPSSDFFADQIPDWIHTVSSFVFVFSLVSYSSFMHVEQLAARVAAARNTSLSSLNVALVGTHADRVDDRVVAADLIATLADRLGCMVFEISSAEPSVAPHFVTAAISELALHHVRTERTTVTFAADDVVPMMCWAAVSAPIIHRLVPQLYFIDDYLDIAYTRGQSGYMLSTASTAIFYVAMTPLSSIRGASPVPAPDPVPRSPSSDHLSTDAADGLVEIDACKDEALQLNDLPAPVPPPSAEPPVTEPSPESDLLAGP